MQDWLYGAWTYRSFFNRAEAVDGLEDLLLAEGELVFENGPDGALRGQLAFRSSPPAAGDARLILAGSIEAGAPATARFRGTGVPGTPGEGWVYDYVGYHVPQWPGGVGQRAALVGSVTRLVDHPGSGGTVRRGGEVFSFVAVRRDFPESRTVIGIAEPVRAMLASRQHRLHHLVWHTVRNLWLIPEIIPERLQNEIAALGWAPPRPVLSPVGDPLIGNGSGEDFLFMHRQMIIAVNTGLEQAGRPPIAAWATIPAPDALVIEPEDGAAVVVPGNPSGFSVPPAWAVPGDEGLTQRLAALKTADFYWNRMRWWDRQFKDPAYLSTLTLGELGTLLEWTVHNDMHMRWASLPRDPHTGELVPHGRQDWDIDPAWDDPAYDHLGDQHSSHVHPVFWRLHGWVDARIEDWFAAHEAAHSGAVTRTHTMGTPWFEGDWVAVDMPWSGPMAMHLHHRPAGGHQHEPNDLAVMEQVIALIFPPPHAAQPDRLAQRRPIPGAPRRRSHF